jgi:ABC-type cobalamin/Fe3+-siderophores transport system ATPase subunit
MIRKLKLKFGKAIGQESLEIETKPITIFVGPNNSGKSKVLSEIAQYCMSGQKNPNDVIVGDIELSNIPPDGIEKSINSVLLKANNGELVQPGHLIVGRKGNRQQVPEGTFRSVLNNPSSNIPWFCRFFLSYQTLILNGSNRIQLVNQQPAGDLQQPPSSSFQELFHNIGKRELVRRIVFEAFGMYLVIDPTNLGQLRLRLSKRPPESIIEEIGIHDQAQKFHSEAMLMDVASDGVKAFTGMIIEAIAGDPIVVLIDEPEAFLHPSLATLLGKELSTLTIESNKRIFVSTHSSNFVMGCIQSGAPINVIRLTYRHNVPTARLLPNDEIFRLMKNPLLRSTGVLSALFYEYVVITESDSDRAFYQEINERLLRYSEDKGIPNCLFINAQNKQTIPTIMKPLRQLGIPVAGIVDIDVIKEGGSVWSNFLISGNVPEIEKEAMATKRILLKNKFDEIGKDMKREGGIKILGNGDMEAAKNLLEQLSEYGLFVVPFGELESWLLDIHASGHGPAWLIDVFDKIGEDPEDPSYLKPKEGDVWAFITSIKNWLMNSSKKGIPL